jgi:hypothetical protein
MQGQNSILNRRGAYAMNYAAKKTSRTFTRVASIVIVVAPAFVGMTLASCSKQTSESAAQSTRPPDAKSARTITTQEAPASPMPLTSSDGLQAFVDPATGELRAPTEAERAALATTAPRKQIASTTSGTPSQSKEIALPDGSVVVPVDPASAESLQGCVGKDGNITMEHSCASSNKDHGAKR